MLRLPWKNSYDLMKDLVFGTERWFPISVNGSNRDWQALGKKIARGMSLEEACIECGIPIEEAFQHVTERASKVDTLNYELRLFAHGAVKNALAKLATLAEGEQRTRGVTDYDDEGKPTQSRTFGPDDLEAAKTLAKFALDAFKLAKVSAVDPGASGDDLFDKSRKEKDPWDLKKVE